MNVTEFCLLSDYEGKGRYERRLVGHVVVDATAKNNGGDAVLLVHAPGFCSWRSHSPDGSFTLRVAVLSDYEKYYPKVRGEASFEKFAAAA